MNPFKQFFAVVAFSLALQVVDASAATRNVLLQPFSSTSIWNMPIGSGAVYSPATIVPPGSIAYDEDIIVLTPTAPLTPVETTAAAWQSSTVNRCDFQTYPPKATTLTVPVPTNYKLDNSLPGMGGTPNNSGAVLAADGQTLIQFQPIQRCAVGGPVSYLTGALFPNTNLYTDGIAGSHGGSGMSALGGTIRLGELKPGSSPIVTGVSDVMRHALKLEFNYGLFDKFGAGPFWPATLADGGNEGLLLALPPTFNFNALQTPPGRSIAWTLVNYGGYIVDASAWDAIQVCMELNTSTNDGAINRVSTQFQTDWGYTFDQNDQSTPWAQDMKTIVSNLQVITNNSASAIGGGGTPRQPLLPPASPSASIALVKTSSSSMAKSGDVVTFTIQYTNTASVSALLMKVVDTIPSGTTLVAGSISSGGIQSGNTITWTLGTVAANTQGSVSFKVTVN